MSHIDYQLLWQSADITNRKLYDSLALVTDQRDQLLTAAQRLQIRGFFRGSALNNPGEMEDITLMTSAIAKALQP